MQQGGLIDSKIIIFHNYEEDILLSCAIFSGTSSNCWKDIGKSSVIVQRKYLFIDVIR